MESLSHSSLYCNPLLFYRSPVLVTIRYWGEEVLYKLVTNLILLVGLSP